MSDPASGGRALGVPAYLERRLSAQMRRVLEQQRARHDEQPQDGGPPGENLAGPRAAYRAERAYWNVGGPTMADTQDTTVTAAGSQVPIRIYRPQAAADVSAPALVYFHGGGFTVGDLDTHDRIQRMLAHHSGAAVVAVDYSLAPEAKHPQQLYEAVAVIDSLVTGGDQWGIDGGRLALAGDSAGGSLALGTALLLRDRASGDGPAAREVDSAAQVAEQAFAAVCGLILVYGEFGLRDSESRRLWGGEWDGMGPADLAEYRTLRFADSADARTRYASPVDADLTGLPPALMYAAELDPLRDDTRVIDQLLRRAGVVCQYHEVPGVLHSYLHFGRLLDAANDTLTTMAGFAAARLCTA